MKTTNGKKLKSELILLCLVEKLNIESIPTTTDNNDRVLSILTTVLCTVFVLFFILLVLYKVKKSAFKIYD